MLQTSETGFNSVFRAQGTEESGMTLTAHVYGCVPTSSLLFRRQKCDWESCFQAVDVAIRGTTDVTLTEYIIVFGCANLLLAQCPHFHAIRYINAVATVCTISFSIIAVCMSIYNGVSHRTNA